jgi:hypothetical protein
MAHLDFIVINPSSHTSELQRRAADLWHILLLNVALALLVLMHSDLAAHELKPYLGLLFWRRLRIRLLVFKRVESTPATVATRSSVGVDVPPPRCLGTAQTFLLDLSFAVVESKVSSANT